MARPRKNPNLRASETISIRIPPPYVVALDALIARKNLERMNQGLPPTLTASEHLRDILFKNLKDEGLAPDLLGMLGLKAPPEGSESGSKLLAALQSQEDQARDE